MPEWNGEDGGVLYVCQLSDALQREIRGILERLLLYYCGEEKDAEAIFGMSLKAAVQSGMDSKLADIGCVLEPVRQGWELEEGLPEGARRDALRLLEIMGGAEPDREGQCRHASAGEDGGYMEEYERER